MIIFRRFLDSSLRFKIVFGVMLSLIPMLVIMGISYSSARSRAMETSERIMKLTNRNGAREITGFIKAQQSVFLDWTREDVFGMAIEFETTAELRSHFESILKGQNGFALVMVTDKVGTIIEAAVSEHLKGTRAAALKGRKVPEASELINNADRHAKLVESDFMSQLGQPSAATFLFSFKTRDSESNPNGFFLAFMDWANLQASVDSVAGEMKTNGYGNAAAAIFDTASSTVLSYSNQGEVDSRLEVGESSKSWIKGANSGEVRKFDTGQQISYIAMAPVQSAAGLFQAGDSAPGGSDLYFMGIVPESDIMAAVRSIFWAATGIAGGGVILIVLIGLFIVRLISKPLSRIIQRLNEGADQVAAASKQISSASQQLAKGSSEQAASIEETSASLEEMSSMTRQNAEHAGQADNLMKEANQTVQQANDSMTELNTSMDQISKASDETSKIIKTIDEIAFQTNLLALNAAVEAARAGEAGAGFAVVADEVRNLAMRAAEAAKDTADLIEGTLVKVSEGTQLVGRTTDAFSEVAMSSSKVAELIGEIAAASNEQAQGVEQVNTAVTEMDKVTQQNAASAEESASASQEMNTQSDQMKAIVGDLMDLVGTGGNGARGISADMIKGTTSGYRAKPPNRSFVTKPSDAPMAVDRGRQVVPEQMIPLVDEDLENF